MVSASVGVVVWPGPHGLHTGSPGEVLIRQRLRRGDLQITVLSEAKSVQHLARDAGNARRRVRIIQTSQIVIIGVARPPIVLKVTLKLMVCLLH